MPRRLALPIALLAAALPLAGCGATESVAPEAVARAAEATKRAQTAALTMRMTMGGFGLPRTFTVRGSGVTSLNGPETDFTLDLAPIMAATTGAAPGSLPLRILVADDGRLYAKPPQIAREMVPGRRAWVRVDIGKLISALGADPDVLKTLVKLDPAQWLDALRRTGKIERDGEERVSGVDTVRYHGTLSIADEVAALPHAKRAAIRRELRRLGLMDTGTQRPAMRYDIWIDDDGLIRRIKAGGRVPSQSGMPAGRMDMTFEFSAFGTKLDTSPPRIADVWDATGELAGALRRFRAASGVSGGA